MARYEGRHRAENKGGQHASGKTSDSPKSGHGGQHDAEPVIDRGRTDAATLLGRNRQN